ncbi:MAG: DUF4942 domain-containing protein [Alistipes sp.]|jgi:hypothetical protein|nr:DUF4942 domain-containing protein [Alistipes sp.]
MINQIFNGDFYPTPPDVIERMMMGVEIMGKVALEPSAGSGNIVEWLKANGAANVLACELSEKLRAMLAGKCDVIGDDFLSVTSEQVSHIDLIVMNPPFSVDERHILHAWEVAPCGCEIVALCNSNTLKSQYGAARKEVFEIVEAYGFSENFGSCFKEAERKTDVEVSVIHLYKPKTGKEEFDDYFSLAPDDENQREGIQSYNLIRDLVNRYVEAVRRFDGVMDASNEINQLTELFKANKVHFGAYIDNESYSRTTITRDYFRKALQKSAWSLIFEKMNMGKYVTTGVREDINRFVERQSHIPFTMHNVFRMLEMIVGTQGHRMQKVLVEAFDHICSFSAENSTAGEKWKTNSGYMINRRFIVPWICDYDKKFESICRHVKLNWGRAGNQIGDVVKALCYLTGTNYDTLSDLSAFVSRMNMEWGQWYEWGFFRIRGYKKGTMHFEFVRDEDWMRFNIEVARIKGWQLPKAR